MGEPGTGSIFAIGGFGNIGENNRPKRQGYNHPLPVCDAQSLCRGGGGPDGQMAKRVYISPPPGGGGYMTP